MTKRNESRVKHTKNVTVLVLGHPDVTVACDIADLSPSGLCLTVRQKIAKGRAVKVDWDNRFLIGRVRHVSAQGIDYRVGVELLYCSAKITEIW